MPITFQDIQDASKRIAGGIYLSPCPESQPLSQVAGCDVYCKLENLQRTGSFKERGARNALMLLGDEAKKKGVIAASAGNHSQGLSYHGKKLGVPVSVVMPVHAPINKVASCRAMGAQVVLHGEDYAQAREHVDVLAKERGLTHVHGFDDPAVIAGQGTIGIEIVEQVPDLEAVVVPIGGGGLIAGIALAVKSLKPDVKVFGVEPANAPSFTAALKAGKPVCVDTKSTLADGLLVNKVGDNAFAVAKQYVDKVVTIDEHSIALAVLRCIELEKSVVEGAGAAGLAALIAGGAAAAARQARGLAVVWWEYRFDDARPRHRARPGGGWALVPVRRKSQRSARRAQTLHDSTGRGGRFDKGGLARPDIQR